MQISTFLCFWQAFAYPSEGVGKPLPMEPDPEAEDDEEEEVKEPYSGVGSPRKGHRGSCWQAGDHLFLAHLTTDCVSDRSPPSPIGLSACSTAHHFSKSVGERADPRS
jgi:hypothetical protein